MTSLRRLTRARFNLEGLIHLESRDSVFAQSVACSFVGGLCLLDRVPKRGHFFFIVSVGRDRSQSLQVPFGRITQKRKSLRQRRALGVPLISIFQFCHTLGHCPGVVAKQLRATRLRQRAPPRSSSSIFFSFFSCLSG